MLRTLLKFGKKILLVVIMSSLLLTSVFTTKSYADYSENTNRDVQVVIRAGEWQNQYKAKVGKRYVWGNDINISEHGLTAKDIPTDIPLRFEDNTFFISEADINLKTSKAIAKKLADLGIDVDMQYATQKSQDLNSAGKIARAKNPEIYLSVHHNSFKTSSSGYFFMSNEKDYKSYDFAQQLSESISDNGKVPRNSNRLNDGYIGELNEVGKDGRIAVLAELGYFSNPEELKMIMSDEYVDDISTKIANEIYYKISEINKNNESTETMNRIFEQGLLINSSDDYACK